MKNINSETLSLEIFSRLDAILILMDLESHFIFSNQAAADLCGYENPGQMLGITAFQMRCPAADHAEHFLRQDAEVRKVQKTFEYLDFHTYADGKPRILLKKKSPFYDNQKLIGTLCFCTSIEGKAIERITGELIKADDAFYQSPKNRSYVLSEHNSIDLSEREMECLFYLVRGFSSKEIGKRLSLSPRTVETYFDRIKAKSGLDNRSDLIDYSLMNGLINYIPRNILSSGFSVSLGHEDECVVEER